MYSKDIETLIRERQSTRKYSDKPVSAEDKKLLGDYAALLDNADYRFKVIDYTLETGKKLGTYGMIKNAKSFLVAVGTKVMATDNSRAIDFGYDFEKIILKATDMGLDTCWMGMSYSEKNLKALAGAGDNERIIMASPLGYASGSRGFIERITRSSIKADQRLAYDGIFFDKDFGKPLWFGLEDVYKNVLELTRLSPSAGNAQPWRIIRRENRLDFYAVGKKLYDNLKDKRIDFTHNDMGIAKLHFELGAERHNIEGRWQVLEGNEIPEAKYMFSWINKHK